VARRAEVRPGLADPHEHHPGSAETHLLITRLMGWDLDANQDRLMTIVTRLARIAEKNS
jgi:hypothetical protein